MFGYFAKIAVHLAAVFVMATSVLFSEEIPDLKSREISSLEEELAAIDAKLPNLARLTMRSGVGNLGWVSRQTFEKNQKPLEWAQIDLGDSQEIDQIILVPVIVRDSREGDQSDGFPQEFKIIAGTGVSSEGVTIAEISSQHRADPRGAPLVISFPPLKASWVRIEAIPVASKVWQDRYGVQLAEMLVFSGEENLALNRPVEVSSTERNNVKNAITSEALVDGLMPYLMDAAAGDKGVPYIAFYKSERTHSFTIDLEQSLPISGVNLHAADIRENVPRIHHADYGMPKRLEISGANQADFSDEKTLTTYTRGTIYETGPIQMLRFLEADCRYIRVTALEGYQAPEAKKVISCFGLAEIEILQGEINVARGKAVIENTKSDFKQGRLDSLTDGLDHFGEILSLKKWLNQLALRHELEKTRPQIVAELQNRYSKQQKYLRIMYWVAGILVVVVLLVILIDRIVRMRHVSRLKQRFAADLHDELGANLNSIGLISDVAKDAETQEEWQTLSARIRDLTERTGTAVRHCTNMLESRNLQFGLPEDMHRAAARITTNLSHEISIKGEEHLEKLSSRVRVDLFLFYRECLINICRHSGATRIETNLVAEKNQISLMVTDNGTGISDELRGKLPTALERRAKLLRGKFTVSCPPSGGTSVHLKLRPRALTMLRFIYPF
ncbi:MAG: hypothetical protein ACSHX9_08690 [Luteolibacter sp.]